VANTLAAIKGKSTQIFAGVFNLSTLTSEVQTIIDAVKANGGNWNVINTVSIGNELVNDGKATVSQATSAVSSARTQLRQAGYQGPVVTVDTMIAMKNNAGLCSTSDYCAINCHAFFDGKVEASGAGAFVQDWVSQISQANGGKTTIVTETGWPTCGQSNGAAKPNKLNQAAAVQSLKNAFSSNMVLYSAYNNRWMQDTASTFGAEQCWGMFGNAPAA